MEGLHFFRKASAEKEFLIDPESGYFIAQNFAHDPVGCLEELRIDMIKQDGIGCFDLVNGAIARIEELRDIISNENITVEDKLVSDITSTVYFSYEWATAVFTLLKLSSYSKSEVSEWILNRNDGLTLEDELIENGMKRALREVYEQ